MANVTHLTFESAPLIPIGILYRIARGQKAHSLGRCCACIRWSLGENNVLMRIW